MNQDTQSSSSFGYPHRYVDGKDGFWYVSPRGGPAINQYIIRCASEEEAKNLRMRLENGDPTPLAAPAHYDQVGSNGDTPIYEER